MRALLGNKLAALLANDARRGTLLASACASDQASSTFASMARSLERCSRWARPGSLGAMSLVEVRRGGIPEMLGAAKGGTYDRAGADVERAGGAGGGNDEAAAGGGAVVTGGDDANGGVLIWAGGRDSVGASKMRKWWVSQSTYSEAG